MHGFTARGCCAPHAPLLPRARTLNDVGTEQSPSGSSARTKTGAPGWANHFETEIGRPRELLAPSLLLLLSESPGHGYDLMERLRPLGFDWGGPGPIYRELRALEDAGFVASDWFVGQSGPGRRVYEITRSGRESLDRSVAGVLGLQRLLAEYQVRLGAIARPLALSAARRRHRVLGSRDGSPA